MCLMWIINKNYLHWTLWIVLLSSTDTFYVVYNWVLSNLKNLSLKFLKNIIISSLRYSFKI